uniref:Phosphoserine phosphatase n=1 Tax=Panagrellus redivivus TaxID=6233 RepID=A0A7E4W782_PANRE
MQPSLEQVHDYAATHPIQFTPGIIELVDALHKRGTDVYLVSGGFRPLILPIAKILGISKSRVYANEILFKSDGSYAGFDINELTSDSGSKNVGKAGVCGLLKKQYHYNQLVMVGDGATDAEACPPADIFIGFGGNQVRPNVQEQADWYVYDFKTLIHELPCDD